MQQPKTLSSISAGHFYCKSWMFVYGCFRLPCLCSFSLSYWYDFLIHKNCIIAGELLGVCLYHVLSRYLLLNGMYKQCHPGQMFVKCMARARSAVFQSVLTIQYIKNRAEITSNTQVTRVSELISNLFGFQYRDILHF